MGAAAFAQSGRRRVPCRPVPPYNPRVAELKTKATTASVSAFINTLADEQQRKDSKALIAMMTRATRQKPVMWGAAIIGFGNHEYVGKSGASKWFQAGFSPRKAALTLYLPGGRDQKLLEKLGPGAKMGGGCLYIKRLDAVDKPTLQKLIDAAVRRTTRTG
jgi:hypothetical protein